ncbi:ABC transporter permease [Iamia sp. SCSIO 61187]|uniref:ABC transporter permease n=1 Tax=Iamia sp. SCSIO 61187 TaxID=2722752 RepID=UPI001C627B8A|nr:ABC transporter permease [Iamia sp. SCSIO 61187]QYG92989.1 ABC transporter permease [Iamia sp. SCSIO 61187]
MSPTASRILKTIARKLIQLFVVLFAVTLFTFLLVRFLPGDPEDLLVPGADNTEDERANQIIREQKEEVREDMGLDEPLPVQYLQWVGGVATGDLGFEYGKQSKEPVSERVGLALPSTLQLVIYSQILALGIAIPFGVLSAYGQAGVNSKSKAVRKAGKVFDRVANATAFGMLSLPNFAVALLLAFWVGVKLNPSLPEWMDIRPQGYVAFGKDPLDHIFSMLLPSLSLAIGQIAVYMRVLRSDLIQTLQEDFILMAKSKGISNRRVLWRHALRPSSLTLVTIAGLQIGTLIGGTVVIEVIFNIKGMGYLIFESILTRQYLMLQSCVAIVAVGFVLINALLDILYTALDPRIRHAG